jgi:hypothetical protein
MCELLKFVKEANEEYLKQLALYHRSSYVGPAPFEFRSNGYGEGGVYYYGTHIPRKDDMDAATFARIVICTAQNMMRAKHG